MSSGKINKYEYVTEEKILLSGQSKIMKQAKFTYSALEKAVEGQIKTIESQSKRHKKEIK